MVPSVAGPKRPQDRIELPEPEAGVSGGAHQAGSRKRLWPSRRASWARASPCAQAQGEGQIRHGSVLIAAITSCTNTSNPSVMLAAGLLAKKAVERGLQVNPLVKASLAPGSRVVTDYLNQTGLQQYLDQLGFNLVGYGCTTCIGNSGPLPAAGGGSDRQARSGGGLGALRQPQFRGARAPEHQGQLPDVAAAGGGLRAGRAGGH